MRVGKMRESRVMGSHLMLKSLKRSEGYSSRVFLVVIAPIVDRPLRFPALAYQLTKH
ncbi:hypothetical protein GIB67_000380 [Kingdonia uniflora]|uniref:Uncharacterized protein n=1 Tax=Kingdonia uniflora TaxID=39325 RepID=A0A7J7MH07_9MAGN|nr:hypothetical protein GIB67_000380 [Kingdonia uniflora]